MLQSNLCLYNKIIIVLFVYFVFFIWFYLCSFVCIITIKLLSTFGDYNTCDVCSASYLFFVVVEIIVSYLGASYLGHLYFDTCWWVISFFCFVYVRFYVLLQSKFWQDSWIIICVIIVVLGWSCVFCCLLLSCQKCIDVVLCIYVLTGCGFVILVFTNMCF